MVVPSVVMPFVGVTIRAHALDEDVSKRDDQSNGNHHA
jgi:hypothetical protein